MLMNKILILGNSGSGKSTFGKQLSEKLNIDLLFLDVFVYDESWDNPNHKQMEDEVQKFLAKDKYIIDGNFLNYAKERFTDCDTIIFLDINRFICLKSVLDRKKEYIYKYRESRSDNVMERINFSYIKWVIFWFYIKSKPKIKKILKDNKDKNIVILKSRKEMANYIDNLKAN